MAPGMMIAGESGTCECLVCLDEPKIPIHSYFTGLAASTALTLRLA